MSAFSAWCQSIAGVAGDSIVLVLVAKWTVLLAVAWLAHGMLAGRDPRWRVALWRATLGGVVLVAVLSWAPPIVEYRFAPAGPATAEVARSASIDSTGRDQAAAADAFVRPSIVALDPRRVSAHVARTGGGARGESNSPAAHALPSAPAERQGARRGAGAVWWVGSIWLTGVLILTVWLILGSLSLVRLVRRSWEVPDGIDQECREDVVSYGRVLARLALRAARPSPVHGLAMARSSDVRRRIEALSRMVLPTRLSWRRVMPAVGFGSVLDLVIGGLGFTRESAPAPHDDRATAASTPQADDPGKPVDQTSPRKLTVRTVAA